MLLLVVHSRQPEIPKTCAQWPACYGCVSGCFSTFIEALLYGSGWVIAIHYLGSRLLFLFSCPPRAERASRAPSLHPLAPESRARHGKSWQNVLYFFVDVVQIMRHRRNQLSRGGRTPVQRRAGVGRRSPDRAGRNRTGREEPEEKSVAIDAWRGSEKRNPARSTDDGKRGSSSLISRRLRTLPPEAR